MSYQKRDGWEILFLTGIFVVVVAVIYVINSNIFEGRVQECLAAFPEYTEAQCRVIVRGWRG